MRWSEPPPALSVRGSRVVEGASWGRLSASAAVAQLLGR